MSSVYEGVVAQNYSLPISEYETLYDLYYATNRTQWSWSEDSGSDNNVGSYYYYYSNYDSYRYGTYDYGYSYSTGYPWIFTDPPENPCSETFPWQGITCNSSCDTSPCVIEVIDLSGMSLDGFIPSSIGNLAFLKRLILSHNYLYDSIPNEVYSLSYLEELSLSNNNFTGTISSDNSIGFFSRILNMFFRHPTQPRHHIGRGAAQRASNPAHSSSRPHSSKQQARSVRSKRKFVQQVLRAAAAAPA